MMFFDIVIFINLSIERCCMSQGSSLASRFHSAVNGSSVESALKRLQSDLEELKGEKKKLDLAIENEELVSETLGQSIQMYEHALNNAGSSHNVTVGGGWFFGGTKASVQDARNKLQESRTDRGIAHRKLVLYKERMASLISQIAGLERTIENIKSRSAKVF